jgi:hypothetical protein
VDGICDGLVDDDFPFPEGHGLQGIAQGAALIDLVCGTEQKTM